MIIVDHYINLFLYFPGLKVREKREITVSKVSKILFCTERNSKLILKRLEGEKWVEWIPGKGRGNHSSITFLMEPGELVLNLAKEFVKKGYPREARKIIEDYSAQFPILKDRFDMWFHSLFGFHTANEVKENQDTLRLKFGKLPVAHLDPNQISLRSECYVVQHVCDTLVTFNKETGRIEPSLAFYWENRDQKVWTFYMRKGVRFHDGHPFSAEDVVYTFKRLFKKENLYSWLVESIDDVSLLDKYTVEFVLKEPNHYFLNLLCDEHLSILPSHLENKTIDAFLIGTGPFKLMRNDESMLVLEAFDTYFGERPFLDRVEYWYVPDDENSPPDFLPKDNDVLWVGVYPQQIKNSDTEQRRSHTQLEWNVQFLSLNLHKNGPLADPNLRMALKGIIHPKDLIKELGGGRGQVATGFLPQEKNIPMDLTRSITSLLNKSTYNGETLHLYTFDDLDHHEDAEWITERCQSFGITVKPTYMSDQELLKIETMRKADIIHDSATMGEQFAVSFLHLLFADNSFIFNHLTDELIGELKKMVKRFFGETCEENQRMILHDIQKQLLDHHAVIPLYRNEAYVNTDKRVQNVKVNTRGWIDLSHIWFKKSK
jgi:MarR-like DNA-binding transcriptional regulator SgrR of sgrS sRNA